VGRIHILGGLLNAKLCFPACGVGSECPETAVVRAAIPLPRRFGRPRFFWLILCGGLLVTAIILGTAVMVGEFREACAQQQRGASSKITVPAAHPPFSTSSFGRPPISL